MAQSDTSPAENAVVINYSGGNQTLTRASRALLIGTAGNLAVDMVGTGTNITLAVPAGIVPVAVNKIYQTGSTAAGVILY